MSDSFNLRDRKENEQPYIFKLFNRKTPRLLAKFFMVSFAVCSVRFPEEVNSGT